MDIEPTNPLYTAFAAVLSIWSLCNVFGDHSKTPIDPSTIPQQAGPAVKAGGSGFFDLGIDISRQLEAIMAALAALHTALTNGIEKLELQLEQINKAIAELQQLYAHKSTITSSSTILLLCADLFILLVFILGFFVAYRAVMREVVGLKAKLDGTHPPPPPPSSVGSVRPTTSAAPDDDDDDDNDDDDKHSHDSTHQEHLEPVGSVSAANDGDAGAGLRYVDEATPADLEAPSTNPQVPDAPSPVEATIEEETQQSPAVEDPVPEDTTPVSTTPVQRETAPATESQPAQAPAPEPEPEAEPELEPVLAPAPTPTFEMQPPHPDNPKVGLNGSCRRCRRKHHDADHCFKPHMCERCGVYAHLESYCRSINSDCDHCHESGHIKRRCPHLYGEAGCNETRFWDGQLRPDEIAAWPLDVVE